MKLRILGCHGPDFVTNRSGALHAYRSIGILVDEMLLVDANTAFSVLTAQAQRRIRFVLLAH